MFAHNLQRFALAAVPALPNSSSQAAGGGALLALPLPALPRPACSSRLPSCGQHQKLDVICICDDICQDTHGPISIVPFKQHVPFAAIIVHSCQQQTLNGKINLRVTCSCFSCCVLCLRSLSLP